MDALENYLRELRVTHATGAGVKETSYYPALANLLNAVGKTLKPRVHCVINVRNQGAGIPDGGLFTPDQLQAVGDAPFKQGPTPARGVIEAKGTGDKLDAILKREQVGRYWDRYGQVLVTNLRDFALVGTDAAGDRAVLERYSLAPDEGTFWTADPRVLVDAHAEPFVQYLSRVMLHSAPLATPKDVAWFLASYARDAKARVDRADLPALAQIRSALEQALGLRFEGERGERFFRSTLVQTLFYGVFSAWVLWSKKHPPTSKTPFNWHDAEYELRVPMIRALFEQLAMGSRLRPLGLIEVLDWTAAALNRVDRAAFFDAFEEDAAVQYFYEPFLEAFDPELRKQLGVWYTPPEIVRYMVERVDTVLREELDLPDGLADPNVYVLDPCTGTGSYLVETLRRIGRTLAEKGDDALSAHQLKRAAMERVVGFEILPAPFVVAHLQLGLLLQDLGVPFAETGGAQERAGVYLTNALTGWDPAAGPRQHLLFPELEAERDAADDVKRTKPILVVLGNPPYNAFAGVSPAEEDDLVEPYKIGLNRAVAQGGWGIRKFNLDDLYVRFFRLAERRIAEQTGKGVVCYISNFSYLTDPSFVVMRRRFLDGFDTLWFDSLNGDSRETGKLTPDGKPDPSVFSTPSNREGIRVGTAIGLMVRKERRDVQPTVRYREFWGSTKRSDLILSLDADDLDTDYQHTIPTASNRYSFRPGVVATNYLAWPALPDLSSGAAYQGLAEDRRKALIDEDAADLERRLRDYFDVTVSWSELKARSGPLTDSYVDFPAREVRENTLRVETFDSSRLRRYAMRPFDLQYCYYTALRPIWRRHRPEYFRQAWPGNNFIVSRFKPAKGGEGRPIAYVAGLCDYHFLTPNVVAIPERVRQVSDGSGGHGLTQPGLFDGVSEEAPNEKANLSLAARAYLAALGVPDPDTDTETAGLLWMNALAIGYSPTYLVENADGLRQDWPRIPLPADKDALLASAALGRQVAALLDTDTAVPGVTAGTIRQELRPIGTVSRVGGGPLDPDAGDLALTAGWGYAGQNNVTMPGRGRLVPRAYSPEEETAIRRGTADLGLADADAFTHLGNATSDVYLNDHAYWRNVPAEVWSFTIGGYQVMKKWLSYREQSLLGRPLTAAEATEVRDMARRLTALRLLQPALDANYRTVTAAAYPWPDATPATPENALDAQSLKLAPGLL